MSDWIEWNGGEQPVPDGTRVEVHFINGARVCESLAEDFWWSHEDMGGDIIKYRVLNEDFVPVSSEVPEGSRIDEMKKDVKEVLAKYRTPVQIAGSHYTSMTVEPIDIAYLNDLSPMQLKVLKYILRYKDKSGVEDLRKARDMICKVSLYEYGVDLENE